VHFSSIAATSADNLAGSVQQAGATFAGITTGSNLITFPAGIPGNYLLLMMVAGATSATEFSTGLSAGATNLNLLTQSQVRDAAGQDIGLGGTTTFPAFNTHTLTVANTGGLVTVTPSTIVGGGSMDLWIFSLPASVLTLVEDEKELRDEVTNMREELSEMREFMRRHRASRRLELEPDSADEDFLGERKEVDVSPYKAAAVVRRK